MATLNTGFAASETFAGASPVTGTAPTLTDGSDGQPVAYLDSITPTVSAPVGQTFVGGGSFRCFVMFPSVTRWSRFKAGDLGAPTAGERDCTYDAVDLLGRFKGAYVKWIPVAVDYTGGGTSGVTVHQQGSPASSGNSKTWGAA